MSGHHLGLTVLLTGHTIGKNFVTLQHALFGSHHVSSQGTTTISLPRIFFFFFFTRLTFFIKKRSHSSTATYRPPPTRKLNFKIQEGDWEKKIFFWFTLHFDPALSVTNNTFSCTKISRHTLSRSPSSAHVIFKTSHSQMVTFHWIVTPT